jgi:hypothetical protein
MKELRSLLKYADYWQHEAIKWRWNCAALMAVNVMLVLIIVLR